MIRSVPGRTPRIHPGAWVDPSAQVIGDVTIEEGASVWPLTVLRGDQDNYVTLGRNSNVQDNSVLHVTPQFPCIVGANVTIGHRCVVHACTIMDNVRIGIGAVVLTGAVVEEGAQVGAGAVVPQGKVVPAGWLVMGVPAKPIRKMSDEELEDIRRNAVEYLSSGNRDHEAAGAGPSGFVGALAAAQRAREHGLRAAVGRRLASGISLIGLAQQELEITSLPGGAPRSRAT
jgi:carbonic anhydrase/acetyltransferase-like protein (isoleucine patch superfamily)